MTWHEEIEALLTRSRLTGRPVEISDQDETKTKNWLDPYTNDWPPGTATYWRKLRDVEGFTFGRKYRLGGATKVRPFTLDEAAKFHGLQIARADNPSEIFDIYGFGADCFALKRPDMDGDHPDWVRNVMGRPVFLLFSDAARDWIFLRDGQGEKSWPPCGVVTEVPPEPPIEMPSSFLIKQNERRVRVMDGILDRIRHIIKPTDEELEQAGSLAGVVALRRQDWLDSVAACLQAVGIDPTTPEGEATTRAYGTHPSDAVRGRLNELANYAIQQNVTLANLVSMIRSSGPISLQQTRAFINAEAVYLPAHNVPADLRPPHPKT